MLGYVTIRPLQELAWLECISIGGCAYKAIASAAFSSEIA